MDGRRREREREPGRGNFVISPANITPSLPSFFFVIASFSAADAAAPEFGRGPTLK